MVDRTSGEMSLTAYPLEPPLYPLLPKPFDLVPAPPTRTWMDATEDRYAYRCLPLLIANQAGWFVLSRHRLTVTWDGGNDPSSLTIACQEGGEPCPAFSRFGHGIVSWLLPYVIRTPAGYNLLVRGPANCPKRGASPLEGIVETNWSVAPFTINWKLTEPGHEVTFAVDEPIAMLVPQARGELENFKPEIAAFDCDSELFRQHVQWAKSRDAFSAEIEQAGSPAQQAGWQKHYFRGRTPGGMSAPAHQSKLDLKPFARPARSPS